MEPSRDDFVIAIRSAFLKKGTQQRFSLIGLIFFSIIIIVLGNFNFKAINYLKISIKEIVYRSSFIISVPENYLKKTISVTKEHFELYDNYEKLKLELDTLTQKKVLDEYNILENKRLQKIVDNFYIESNEIFAKILIDKQSPFLKSVVVNKGSKDNVKMGMTVLDGEYLIGKIVEVNYLSARVLLLSDLNSKIPVSIEPGGLQSILSGTGDNHGIIQYQQKENVIKDNNIVYTSGAGGLFKSGIPVGKIETIDSSLIGNKRVNFFSDFTQPRFVKIVSYKVEK
jgi:rod shape-determining protein MreC